MWPRSPVRTSRRETPSRWHRGCRNSPTRRADSPDLAGLEGLEFAAVIALDSRLHAGALEAAGADPPRAGRPRVVQIGRITVMLPVTSPSPKYCTSICLAVTRFCTYT